MGGSRFTRGSEIPVSEWLRDFQWNIPPSFQRRYPSLVDDIKRVAPSNSPDRVRWSLTRAGQFHTASCYEHLRTKGVKVPWANIVWEKVVTPRHAFLLWLVILGRLKNQASFRRGPLL